jgi:hypothetical protein
MYSSKLNDRFIVAERKRTRVDGWSSRLSVASVGHLLQNLPETLIAVSRTLIARLPHPDGSIRRAPVTRVCVRVAHDLQPIRCAAGAVRLDTLRKTREEAIHS